MEDFTTTYGNSVAEAAPAERAAFIRRTYLLLAAAILAFVAVEGFLFASGLAVAIASVLFSGGAIGWLLVLGLFMGVSFLANRWATSETSTAVQYAGLGIFIIAEAIIFIPLILIATSVSGDSSVLLKAGIVTLGLFLGIPMTVFITPNGFFVPPPGSGDRGVCGVGIHSCECDLRLFARNGIRLCDGRIRRHGDLVRNIQCTSPL